MVYNNISFRLIYVIVFATIQMAQAVLRRAPWLAYSIGLNESEIIKFYKLILYTELYLFGV